MQLKSACGALLKMGFLGGGKTAQAMAQGFISAGLVDGKNLRASFSPQDEANMVAFRGLGAQTFTENLPVVQDSQVVFITVKPWIVPLVLDSVKSISGGKLFISVAMGLKLADLEQSLVPEARVIRVMPNIPTLTLFESVGTCDEVTEALIDPITALSGSGPGYVFAMIEAMADGAVKMGLSRDLAYKLAAQTLKDDVASPGGSTIHGLSFLEKNAFRYIVAGAIEAATNRCREFSTEK
ncbi:hypothetical protein pipiens_001977 [Culex pipiens pipiens]|uniref:pyrroline-5-carboxylate reductase n=1 Tax=Culex pipiens pipiens TaxID=38569 RepID=A0ABD1DNA1_CULPP